MCHPTLVSFFLFRGGRCRLLVRLLGRSLGNKHLGAACCSDGHDHTSLFVTADRSASTRTDSNHHATIKQAVWPSAPSRTNNVLEKKQIRFEFDIGLGTFGAAPGTRGYAGTGEQWQACPDRGPLPSPPFLPYSILRSVPKNPTRSPPAQ